MREWRYATTKNGQKVERGDSDIVPARIQGVAKGNNPTDARGQEKKIITCKRRRKGTPKLESAKTNPIPGLMQVESEKRHACKDEGGRAMRKGKGGLEWPERKKYQKGNPHISDAGKV